MYTTYFLRFATQEEAEQKLTEVGYSTTDPETDQIHFHTPPHTGALDIIGTIYNNDGVYDEESGEVVTPPTAMEGYHINIILKESLPQILKSYLVSPKRPYRVFA
jgi:hypothetical protein